MKLFRVLMLIFLMITFLFSNAKSVITVSWPGGEGAIANFYTYTDFITFNKQKIASVKIGTDEKISVNINFQEVVPVYIQVQFFRFDILVEPNKNYNIEVSETNVFDPKFSPSYVIAYLKPNFSIVGEQAKGVNYELKLVDSLIGGFLGSNYLEIYKGRLDSSRYNSFLKDVRNLHGKLKTSYARELMDFELMQLKYSLRKIGDKQIVAEIFVAKNLKYNNLAFMNFFNRFYSKYLITGIKGLKYNELENTINEKRSYNELSRLLSPDPLLVDSTVRQLVVLLNIQQMYTLRRFSKQGLEDILTDIGGKGINKQNREIAIRMKENLSKYEDGKASDYYLPDFSGSYHDLKEHEGKYIYLNVWNLDCKECLVEMTYLTELNAEFDDIIDFVSVYVGYDTIAARQYIINQGFKWQNLYFNNDFDFISNYKVELFPYFTLIGKQGQIEVMYPNHPSQGFKDSFIELLNKKKNNLKLDE